MPNPLPIKDDQLASVETARAILKRNGNTQSHRAVAGTLSKRYRDLIDLVVFDGLTVKEAAEAIGINKSAAQRTFEKPIAQSYFEARLQVRRTAARARNLHRAEEIRDGSHPQAAIQAIKWIEPMPDTRNGTQVNVNINLKAGYVLDLSEDDDKWRADRAKLIEGSLAGAPDSASGGDDV